jgi:protein-S-isoprenylcysteine O-methyltransferase Ste14
VGLSILSALYFPLSFYGLDNLIVIVGIISFGLGYIICFWAKITMKHNWGDPASFNKKRQKELVINGPFKFTRNPIYLGMSLIYIGYALALKSTFGFLVLVPLYYFWSSAIIEEEILKKEFGKKYLEYKNKVPFVI